MGNSCSGQKAKADAPVVIDIERGGDTENAPAGSGRNIAGVDAATAATSKQKALSMKQLIAQASGQETKVKEINIEPKNKVPDAEEKASSPEITHKTAKGMGLSKAAIMARKMQQKPKNAFLGVGKLHERGVTVKFLVQFTNEYDCWDMTAWQVVENIIRPLTEPHGRCAAVNLPDVRSANVVGDASVFVSYSWAAKWGTMVSAVAQHASESRMVWLDVFALRQWDEDENGKPIRSAFNLVDAMVRVVKQVKGLIFVVEMQEDVVKMDFEKAQEHDFDATAIFRKRTWEKVAFARLWCLYEMCIATTLKIPVVMKVGYADELGMFVESNAREMLQNLFLVVDLRSAACSLQADTDAILKAFEKFNTADGRDGMLDKYELPNNMIKVNITMGLMWMGDPVLQAAALGEFTMMNELLQLNKVDSLMIHSAAAAGLVEPLQLLVAASGVYLDIADTKGYTPVMKAAVWGHTKVVKVLVQAGADLTKANRDGATAIMMARAGKFYSLVEWMEGQLKPTMNVHETPGTVQSREPDPTSVDTRPEIPRESVLKTLRSNTSRMAPAKLDYNEYGGAAI